MKMVIKDHPVYHRDVTFYSDDVIEKIKEYINKQLLRGVDKFEDKVLYKIANIIESEE